MVIISDSSDSFLFREVYMYSVPQLGFYMEYFQTRFQNQVRDNRYSVQGYGVLHTCIVQYSVRSCMEYGVPWKNMR